MSLLHLPWYCFVAYVVVLTLILWVFDRYRIIKSKSLRYFIVIFVYSFLFWIVYDFVTGAL